jgi:TonB family protein
MLALLILPAALAQRPQCPRAAGDTAAAMPPSVDQMPVADTANRWPTYPGLLRQAGIQGAVRAAFTVDTAGAVEPPTIVIERTPNPGFDVGVKRTVATWRFTPARLCGRPVRVRLRHEFGFRASVRTRDTLQLDYLFGDSLAGPMTVTTVDTLSDGTPRTMLEARSPITLPPSAFSDFATLDSAARDSAEEAALAVLVDAIAPAKDSLTRIVCISGGRGPDSDPDRGRLVRLTRPGVAVLPVRRCPRTFSSMIFTPGQLPEPPGEDPYRIRFMSKRVLSPTQVLFDVDVARGTGGNHHRCGATRRSNGWRARCFSYATWMS